MGDEPGPHHRDRELGEGSGNVLGQRVEDEAHGPDREDAREREPSPETAHHGAHDAVAPRQAVHPARRAEGEERRARDQVTRPHRPARAPLDEAGVDAEQRRAAHRPHQRRHAQPATA